MASSFSLAGSTNLTASSNTVTLNGTAPIGIKTIKVNDQEWPVTWTSVITWSLYLPLVTGTNQFLVEGYDAHENPVTNAVRAVSVVYSQTPPSPAGAVVISEIMSNPRVPDAEYVELFNTSSNQTFDLSGWIFKGLSYTFPAGSLMRPRSFLVLAKDRVAFDIAYGAGTLVFDEFSGNLQLDGETLTLVRPGTNTASDLVVAKVRYDGAAPWPVSAPGVSLQLIDPAQDNWRAGNWAVLETNRPVVPQWVYFSMTATAPIPGSIFTCWARAIFILTT